MDPWEHLRVGVIPEQPVQITGLNGLIRNQPPSRVRFARTGRPSEGLHDEACLSNRNSRRCPEDISKRFHTKDGGLARAKLFQDWMWNGRSTEMLSVVYQKIIYYKEVDSAWHDGELQVFKLLSNQKMVGEIGCLVGV